jgi:HSP20 family molecular chaperone IbpA
LAYGRHFLCPTALWYSRCALNRKKEKSMENRLDILTSVDVLNTLHGGTVEPQVLQVQGDDSQELRIHVPSIDPATIEVEINNNRLVIYYTVNLTAAGKNLRLPYSIYNKTLPYYVDISRIHSTIESNMLVITLPFNMLANGYHRKIKTDRD